MNRDEIIKIANEAAPSWTSNPERQVLLDLAEKVPAGGSIIEVGGLYGGMTSMLGLTNPQARITVVDNFSWSPLADRPASKEELLKATRLCGLTNVEVLEGDSCEIGKAWKQPVDLLWIDGGHTFEICRADLENFGVHARVIAVHDWDNTFLPGIRLAVQDFMRVHEGWEITTIVEMVVVLVRKDS